MQRIFQNIPGIGKTIPGRLIDIRDLDVEYTSPEDIYIYSIYTGYNGKENLIVGYGSKDNKNMQSDLYKLKKYIPVKIQKDKILANTTYLYHEKFDKYICENSIFVGIEDDDL